MEPNSGTEVCPHCGYAGEGERLPHVLRPGTILKDQYLLGEPLGQGGFGITYIARDLNLDIRVAIKEYYPNGFANRNVESSDLVTITDERLIIDVQKGKDSFLKEARTLARFRGTPGIVDVLHFFEANNTAYIVMEYLDGETLGHRLKRELFTADEIFQLMDPVFNTLEKIHMQDVVHRDISPDNIMIMPDGSLKLMDFGAARLMNYVDQRSVSVVLKAGYAPLEQYSTKGEQGPWTDVYALCATIYKCITGKTPADPHDRLMGEAVPWPSELGLPISVRQENALKQGMAIFQKDRFQTIGELRSTLRKEDSGSMESGPITTEPRASDEKTVALSKKSKTAPAEEKPAVKAENEKTTRSQRPAKQPKTGSTQKETVARKKRRPPLLWIGGAALGLIVLALVLIALLGGKQKKETVGALALSQTASDPKASPLTSAATFSPTSEPTSAHTPKSTAAAATTSMPTPASTPEPAAAEVLTAVSIGDTISFGKYEQDNISSNGKEDIEWIVLAKEDDRFLVISKYALDCQPYHKSYANVTWETCSLREWLNGSFLSDTFNTEEQNGIISSTVTADSNPAHDTVTGNDTEDKVFLLSIPEADKYFDSDSARQCRGTAYCYVRGASKAAEGNCWWWLRSPGSNPHCAAAVRNSGAFLDYGYNVNVTNVAVRPAMWIDAGSLELSKTKAADPTVKPADTFTPQSGTATGTAVPYYTVTFDAGRFGTASETSRRVQYGQPIGSLPSVTKTVNSWEPFFIGWNASADTIVTQDMTVTAIWKWGTPPPSTPTPTPISTPTPTPTPTPTWSDWSTELPPADAIQTESKDQYRFFLSRDGREGNYVTDNVTQSEAENYVQKYCNSKVSSGEWTSYQVSYVGHEGGTWRYSIQHSYTFWTDWSDSSWHNPIYTFIKQEIRTVYRYCK